MGCVIYIFEQFTSIDILLLFGWGFRVESWWGVLGGVLDGGVNAVVNFV